MPPPARASGTAASSAGARLEPARVSGPVEPSTALTPPRQAFLDGYRAYAAHDLPRAVERLTVAADTYPELGDYALLYLGYAQRDMGDLNSAEASFNRLVQTYRESALYYRAKFELAEIALKHSRPQQARDIAVRLCSSALYPELAPGARLIVARALAALGKPREALGELRRLREEYPHGSADAQAREETRALLAAYSGVLDSRSLYYHIVEAELLLKEGLPAEARGHLEKAARLRPTAAQRGGLLIMTAESWTSDPQRRRQALNAYLELAPKGPLAPQALYGLGRLAWHENDTARARAYLSRLTDTFPGSVLAPEAMLKIGRTFEDDRNLDDARGVYQVLLANYSRGEAVAEARFRLPWVLYLAGKYEKAAQRFGAGRASATDPAERDMFGYWQGRALEKAGAHEQARAMMESVAASIDSNYYPALAARRIAARPVTLPAATVADPIVNSPPAVSRGDAFHLNRALELKAFGLDSLEADELRELGRGAGDRPPLRDFVLVELQAAGHYHDALTLARTMAEQGAMSPELAERFRYPRAYWSLLAPAAQRTGLDPYLLLALTRQESLFDPEARSPSDAQGLMQLLPSTARTIAAEVSMPAARLDLFDPAVNIELGTAYLKKLLSMFGGNAFKAVAAYNGGEHAVERWNARFSGDDDEWVENIDFHETREYVKKVLGGLREYRLLYASASSA